MTNMSHDEHSLMAAKKPCPFSEEVISAQFPWLQMPAEEYAARNSHGIGAFSLDQFEYKNVAFGEWLSKLGRLLRDERAITECRKKYLSQAEQREIERFLADLASGKADL